MRQLINSTLLHMTSHKNRVGSAAPGTSSRVTWVQTERATHEAWGMLTVSSPRAAALAHFLVANMEATGAVVASYATLSKMSGMSVSTIRRAVDDLKAGRWIEVVQIGGKGGANAFIVNSRVGWAEQEQTALGRVLCPRHRRQSGTELHRRCAATANPYPDAGRAPVADWPGEDPPSQPAIDGMEPDLPSLQAELEKRGQQRLLED